LVLVYNVNRVTYCTSDVTHLTAELIISPSKRTTLLEITMILMTSSGPIGYNNYFLGTPQSSEMIFAEFFRIFVTKETFELQALHKMGGQ
jgi:hypothetical protein